MVVRFHSRAEWSEILRSSAERWSSMEAASGSVRRDTMDSAVSKGNDVEESRNAVLDPVQQSSFGASVPLPQHRPSATPVMQLAESGAPAQVEEKSNFQSGTEKSTSLETASPKIEQAPLRRSIRVRRAPNRLIETIK